MIRFNEIDKTMRKIGILTAVIGILAFSGCNYLGPCINGNGPVISELRAHEDFYAVSNTGSFDVYISHADSFSVEVLAQENLVPLIETYQSGGMLTIRTDNNDCFKSSSPVIINVTMPRLEEVRLSGSGKVLADLAVGEMVEVANSGSGYMQVDTVYADSYELKNSGSGSIVTEESYAEEVKMTQSGSGKILGGILYETAELVIRHSSSGRVTGTVIDGTLVDAVLSGSGRISLSGGAAVADYLLNSSGRIDALDLEILDMEATNTGSGNILCWATDFLDATITGSGSILYKGTPLISSTDTGSGSLRPY